MKNFHILRPSSGRRLVRRPLLLAIIATVITIAGSVFPLHAESKLIEWNTIATDLEYTKIPIGSQRFFRSEAHFVRSSLSMYKIKVIRATEFGLSRGSSKILCERSKARVCINANFFDENIKPLGLVISRGLLIQGVHRGGKTLTGIFQRSQSKIEISHRTSFNPTHAIEAIQAGPRLLQNGALIEGLSESSSASRRAGVCIDSSDRLILFTMESGFWSLSLETVAEILMQPGIECRDALNLDGGGSTQMSVRDNSNNSVVEIEGTDEVPVLLGLFPASATY